MPDASQDPSNPLGRSATQVLPITQFDKVSDPIEMALLKRKISEAPTDRVRFNLTLDFIREGIRIIIGEYARDPVRFSRQLPLIRDAYFAAKMAFDASFSPQPPLIRTMVNDSKLSVIRIEAWVGKEPYPRRVWTEAQAPQGLKDLENQLLEGEYSKKVTVSNGLCGAVETAMGAMGLWKWRDEFLTKAIANVRQSILDETERERDANTKGLSNVEWVPSVLPSTIARADPIGDDGGERSSGDPLLNGEVEAEDDAGSAT